MAIYRTFCVFHSNVEVHFSIVLISSSVFPLVSGSTKIQNTVPVAAIAPNTKYTVLGLRASPIEGMKRTTRKERLQLKHAQKELAKALK